MLERLGDRCGLFAQVDDHWHLVMDEEPAQWGRLAGRVTRLLRAATDVGVQAPHVKAVDGAPHLRNLVGYLARQPEKHGLREHPALWADGCFGDLVGVRWLPRFRPELLWSWLPRWRREHVYELLGLVDPGLATLEMVREHGLHALAAMAAAAFDADLAIRSRATVRARRGVMRLGLEAGFRQSEVARTLELSRQRASSLAAERVPPELTEVLLRRLALERMLRGD